MFVQWETKREREREVAIDIALVRMVSLPIDKSGRVFV